MGSEYHRYITRVQYRIKEPQHPQVPDATDPNMLNNNFITPGQLHKRTFHKPEFPNYTRENIFRKRYITPGQHYKRLYYQPEVPKTISQQLVRSMIKKQGDISVFVIADGNGRAAVSQGKERHIGHEMAIAPLFNIILEAQALGIDTLIPWVLSVDNITGRGESEVEHFFQMLRKGISNLIPTLIEIGMKIDMIGNIELLPENLQESILQHMDDSKSNTGMNLVLGVGYSAKDDILRAVQSALHEDSAVTYLTEDSIFQHTDMRRKKIRQPDLLIRTSGEIRHSGAVIPSDGPGIPFVSAQELFPDYTPESFRRDIYKYLRRQRIKGR
ncbi:MAG: polyprenyl diphosphate synthase [Candidatus Roizmanbacteria bacterium]